MGDNPQKTDILIVGAGPAGLTAAIYASWLGLKTLVLESGNIGGKAWLAPKIENYPGFQASIKGSELAENMSQQATRFGAELIPNEEVIGLELRDKIKRVVTRKQSYEASAVILATGTQKKKLRVAGESEFLGMGVSYCAVCDGPFFRNSSVVVVGNGEEAAVDALFLADIAQEVAVVSQNKELNIEGALISRLKSKPNVEIIKGQVQEIIGEKTVRAVKIQEFDTQRDLRKDVKGVFVAIGGVPMTAIVKNAGVAMDSNGCLTVDRQQRTNVEGVFAAGDCTCGGMQVVTAAGEGASAAMKASAYARKRQ